MSTLELMASEYEELMGGYLDIVYPGETIIRNHRPEWLRNEETGRNLELDFYLPKRKIAFEVQGYHHSGGRSGDSKQVRRDAIKSERCRRLGIKLCEVYGSILKRGLENFLNFLLNHQIPPYNHKRLQSKRLYGL